MNEHGGKEDWGTRGEVATRVSVFLSVLSVIAVVVAHHPIIAGDTADAVAAASVSTETAPYYFPSQYELHAAEPGEPVPTF
jgi:hypothetical protein